MHSHMQSAGNHGSKNLIVAMKRAPFLQSGANDHCAQSSDGSHYAGNASKRARIIQQQCRSEFTEKIDLLFADGDKMHPRLRQQLVIDNRPSLKSHDLKMFVEEFEADIVIAADCDPLKFKNSQIISTEDTTWQVWCNPDSWKISQHEIFDLIPGWRHAVWITVQRSTSCDETLNIIAIKTLKGLPVAKNPLFFSPGQRQQVANEIFKLLSLATCPTVVLGNIGFAFNSCLKHLEEYERVTESDLGAEVQIVTTDDEALMLLFRDSFGPIASTETTEIITNAPTKIMITRLDTNTPCMLYTRLNTRMYAATNILNPAPVHTVLRCDVCDERMTKNEAKQCATCAAVLEESISGESLFAQCNNTGDELRRSANNTQNHLPCPSVRDNNGLHQSSQSSKKSRYTPSRTLREQEMINSLNIEPLEV